MMITSGSAIMFQHSVVAMDPSGTVISTVYETLNLEKAEKVRINLINDLLDEPRTINGVEVAGIEIVSERVSVKDFT